MRTERRPKNYSKPSTSAKVKKYSCAAVGKSLESCAFVFQVIVPPHLPQPSI